MYLHYENQLRNETDEEVIENLLRKGWEETVPPTYNELVQYEPEWVDGSWLVRDKYPDASYILATLASIRYQKETAGIVIGEQPITTLRDEMPVWQGMLLDMTLRPGATAEFEYKPRGGTNVTLTPQQVGRCYECFAWYVNACFATERYLASQIGVLTTEQIIELAQNIVTWPQTQFSWIPE